MNKRVGIITRYYKSINYGGNLQAYALCQFLNKNGFEAEQICFSEKRKHKNLKKSFLDRLILKIKRILKNPVRELFIAPNEKRLCKKYNVWERRKNAFYKFNTHSIPHSNEVFYTDSIFNCVEDYDVFITGSDIVWNLKKYDPPYFLNFVPDSKIKIAYAASLGMDSLTEEQRNFLKQHLQGYLQISVRENDAVELLKEITSVKPIQAADPTLLLSKSDWDSICSNRLISRRYVFCYFLGNNKKERVLAKKYAAKRGLQVVSIQPSVGTDPILLSDFQFGDIRLYDVTPEDFISLIKYAECVFTDSFHAVVFSSIYEREFFVFNRNKTNSLNTRIKSIVELFGTEERFCCGKERESLHYLLNLNPLDYKKINIRVDELKEISKKFLLNGVQGDINA